MKNYGFISDAILFTCTHAHKALSNRKESSFMIAELVYGWFAWRLGLFLGHLPLHFLDRIHSKVMYAVKKMERGLAWE